MKATGSQQRSVLGSLQGAVPKKFGLMLTLKNRIAHKSTASSRRSGCDEPGSVVDSAANDWRLLSVPLPDFRRSKTLPQSSGILRAED